MNFNKFIHYWIFRWSRLCFVVFLFPCFSMYGKTAKGIAWDIPEGHFEGIDHHGCVFLAPKIADVELDSKNLFPIYILFNSASENHSPYLGYGWSIPILESQFVQVDENYFRLLLPNGVQRVFRRDKKNLNLLRSSNKWEATIKGNSVEVVCKYGSRLVFRNGKIISFETTEGRFKYVYAEGRVTKILRDQQTILSVGTDAQTGNVTKLILNKKTIELKKGQRPQIQVMGTKNRIAMQEESLSKITLPDGTILSFEYGVDAYLNPTLKSNKQEFVWNPLSKKVIWDGEWNYEIVPSSYPGGYAAITRTSLQGQSEYWYKDIAKGEERSKGIDGVEQIKTWFTSGKLNGRPRKEEEIRNGIKIPICKYSYNEDGLLIRIERGKLDTLFVYDDKNRIVALVQNGKIVRSYTEEGALLAQKYIK